MTEATPTVEQELSGLDYHTFEFNGETYKVKKRFKRLKFLRLLSEDPGGAFALAFTPDELERLEESELSEEEFEDLLEIVAKTLLGGKGN